MNGGRHTAKASKLTLEHRQAAEPDLKGLRPRVGRVGGKREEDGRGGLPVAAMLGHVAVIFPKSVHVALW